MRGRMKGEVNRLQLRLPALSVNEGMCRAAVGAFCAQLGPTASQLADIQCAVSEAVTNSVVHAYRSFPGDCYITAILFSDRRVRISVRDTGCGIPDIKKAREPLFTTDAAGERSGMGFTVMEAFMDSVRVYSRPGKGTLVVLDKKVGQGENPGKRRSRVEETSRQARHYALIRAAQSTTEEAAGATDTLVKENMGLVYNAVARFRDRGIEYEDLVQIGILGMLRAIRTFDLSRGTAFSTFAVPLIVGEIRRNLRDDGILHVSRTYKQLGARLARARHEISEREGREATLAEMADACGVGLEEAAMALSALLPVESLSGELYEEQGETLSDRLTDDESANEPEILNDRLALSAAIGKMPPLWRRILLLRYFKDRTQQETANLLGLSQVKISREEKKILSFLRGEMTV